MEILSRQEAIKLGAIKYFHGRPCKHGHIAQRYVLGGSCCKCQEELKATDDAREKRRQRCKIYYKNLSSTPEGRAKLREDRRRLYAVNPKRRKWKNTEKAKQTARRTALRQYGVTVKQYEEICASQNYCCAICGKKETQLRIDHCHASNKVRGLLCFQCNVGLGNFKDDVEKLKKAIAYLQKQEE